MQYAYKEEEVSLLLFSYYVTDLQGDKVMSDDNDDIIPATPRQEEKDKVADINYEVHAEEDMFSPPPRASAWQAQTDHTPFDIIRDLNDQRRTRSQVVDEDLKAYMSKAPLLSKLLPGESLILYLLVTTMALSSISIRRPNNAELPIFYTSHALQNAELRYPRLEKLAYALIISPRKLRPYFQAHTITVLTNQPLRKVL
ncbi:hypothetical protein L3X38_036581 [Prunus dulcis]|uniref:Reverse transcriptase/retrotransposon-derived protein RNase H-like domain-containing protein n=1 Tax=Prunus dulcis TaxID=3755 RepID=A0AAD4V1R9_PRUDU|nr:hypothetical protein L3X38_036581 [Prunus dulcis]